MIQKLQAVRVGGTNKMAFTLEEKVLFKVLDQISKNEHPFAAPDKEYLKSLENIGMIENGWDVRIKPLGIMVLNHFRSLDSW